MPAWNAVRLSAHGEGLDTHRNLGSSASPSWWGLGHEQKFCPPWDYPRVDEPLALRCNGRQVALEYNIYAWSIRICIRLLWLASWALTVSKEIPHGFEPTHGHRDAQDLLKYKLGPSSLTLTKGQTKGHKCYTLMSMRPTNHLSCRNCIWHSPFEEMGTCPSGQCWRTSMSKNTWTERCVKNLLHPTFDYIDCNRMENNKEVARESRPFGEAKRAPS